MITAMAAVKKGPPPPFDVELEDEDVPECSQCGQKFGEPDKYCTTTKLLKWRIFKPKKSMRAETALVDANATGVGSFEAMKRNSKKRKTLQI